MGRAERRRQERAAQKRETAERQKAGIGKAIWKDARELGMIGKLTGHDVAEKVRAVKQLEAVRRIERNGITMEEMEEEYERGGRTSRRWIGRSCFPWGTRSWWKRCWTRSGWRSRWTSPSAG